MTSYYQYFILITSPETEALTEDNATSEELGEVKFLEKL